MSFSYLSKSLIIFNLCFSALKKHGAGLCSLLKRLVFPFNKDSADLLSALLDFLRQIVNTETMVSTWFYGSSVYHVYQECTCAVEVTVEIIVKKMFVGSSLGLQLLIVL